MTVTAIDLATTRWTEAMQKPTVYLRSAWEDPWVEYPYLHCISLRLGVGQQIDQAHLQYDYGQMHRAGVAAVQTDAPLEITRMFCKVEMPSPNSSPAGDIDGFIWFGVIISVVDTRLGQQSGGGLLDEAGNPILDEAADPILADGIRAGRQDFTAYGMEWMLTRVWIDKSVYESVLGVDVEVKRVIPFNAGTKQQLEANDVQILGNKAPGQNRFIRPDLVSAAVVWTAFDILEYLFEVFAPTDSPVFALHSTVEDHTDWWQQNNLILGPTLYDAMNQLISPRRGLAWSVFIDDAEADPTMYIRVHSFSDVEVSLAGSTTMSANDQQVSIDESTMRHVSATQVTDTSRVFEQVKVIGARRGGCFTVSFQDETLDRGWSDFQLEAYANAADGVTPQGERKKEADAFRATDTMANVLTRFIIPDDWNGFVGDGTGAIGYASQKPTCPLLDDDGDIIADTQSSFWHPGMRLAGWIPLRENVDYQYDAAAPDNYNEDFLLPPYRKPFALYQLPGGEWVRADRANVLAENEASGATKNGLKFSAFVYPTSDQFGLYIRPSTLAHAHSSGTELDDVSTTIGGFDTTTDTPREVNWEYCLATVFSEFDEHVEIVYPLIAQAGTNGQQSIQVLHVGSTARLDYLAPNTVLDVAQDGTLIANATGGFVRDDRELMEKMAKVAWTWYSIKRTALSIVVAHITNQFAVGQLVTSLSGDTVNTMVTYITYDFEQASTTINTDFAELDPSGLFI